MIDKLSIVKELN